jgi:hypothetical protein
VQERLSREQAYTVGILFQTLPATAADNVATIKGGGRSADRNFKWTRSVEMAGRKLLTNRMKSCDEGIFSGRSPADQGEGERGNRSFGGSRRLRDELPMQGMGKACLLAASRTSKRAGLNPMNDLMQHHAKKASGA